MLKSAYLYFQNDEVHRVVNLGVRAVHRAIDTGAPGELGLAAGGWKYARGGNGREGDTVGHWRTSFDAAPGRRGGGGRDFGGRLAGRTDVPSTQKAPLMQGHDRRLSARKRHSPAAWERQLCRNRGHSLILFNVLII